MADVDDDDDDDDGDEDLHSPTRTPTTTTTVVTSRIAFGSCHKSERSATPPIWDTILPPGGDDDSSSSSPTTTGSLDAWLWLGDAMYPSHRDPVTRKKHYGPAPPLEIAAGLRAMKHENATIGYKGFLDRLRSPAVASGKKKPPIVTGAWDDHDFGGNDMGSGMPDKHERRRIYRDFLGHPPGARERRPWSGRDGETDVDADEADSIEGRRRNDGLYHRVDLEDGRIRILVLDTRWFREDHCIPSVAHSVPKGNAVACLTRWLTSGLLLHRYAWLWGKGGCENAKVLGDEQWAWLENELLLASSTDEEEEPPELFVILSSIQVWSTNPLMEGWGHFPGEQERLWNLLRTHYRGGDRGGLSPPPPAPVLFLSGDVHHAEISGRSGYREITSSGLTHHCGQHKVYGPVCEPILRTFTGHRHGSPSEGVDDEDTGGENGYYIGVNYGLLEILEGEEIDGDDDDDERDGVVGVRKRAVRASIRNTTGHSVLEVVQPLAGHGPVPVLPPYHQRARTWDGHLIPYAQGASLCAVIGLVSIVFLRIGMR